MATKTSKTNDSTKFSVGMKQARQISTMMRGVTDFSNTAQFNQYETGYEFIIVCSVPTFLSKLALKNATAPDGTPVKTLLNNFVIAIEQENRGMTGFEDITADTIEITDGISTLNMISKINKQSASTFNVQLFEKSGTPITKFLDYYLSGIKDPRTQAKTYHGALDNGWITEPGLEKEVFTLMYINTDNTMKKIEKAYLIVNAQPNKSETSMYEATKGDIANKELTIEFNGFPLDGKYVDALATQMLDYLYSDDNDAKVILQSNEYDYFMTNSDTRGFTEKGYTEDTPMNVKTKYSDFLVDYSSNS